MKRALIICLFGAICINAGVNFGYCETPIFPPLQPLSANGFNNSGVNSIADTYAKNPYLADSNISYPKISEIERSLYGRNYTAQDILLRLARIEKSIFSTSYPTQTLANRVDNIIMNYNKINQLPNISKNSLSGIEAKVLKKNYAKNDVKNRIERLEQSIFGAVQSGDLAARFETIKAASESYNLNQNVTGYNQTPTINTKSGWNGMAGNLCNMLMGRWMNSGYMTGFTPPIDPFDNYTSAYNNNNNNGGYNDFASMGGQGGYGSYNGYRSNRGYSDTFSNCSSGSRVTILD